MGTGVAPPSRGGVVRDPNLPSITGTRERRGEGYYRLDIRSCISLHDP